MTTMPMTAAVPLLRLRDVRAGYGGGTILNGVDLDLARGEVLALLGRNGAGKTTLLHTVFNLGPTVQGEIHVRGEDVHGWPTHRIAQLGVALVPQGRGVFADLDVQDSLRLATLAPRPQQTTPAWTLDAVYARFPRLFERRRTRSGALSGGERQMLALGRALLTQADVIALDEPSEGLAPQAVAALQEHLAELARDGTTLLLVEQNTALALHLAHRVAVLGHGRVVFDGTPEALAADRATLHTHLGV
ncbi:ABC transporter ATP-binding protein [Verticiella alkaliphila]|uniref:ABC transporter ATP-binding protein n=1 Tax=Verticiella alkaliphila TaxID=2779529 RepID=UPI00209B356D|nr:ABC transporter ATP-binding protein [Verticiella sp. GG226]